MNAIKPLKELTIGDRPMLADPFVLRTGEGYFAIGTSHTTKPLEGGVFPAYYSSDFENWEDAGCVNLPRIDGQAVHYWAPEIVYSHGVYFLYLSLGITDNFFEIRVATSASPLGPYVIESKPVLDSSKCTFAIDAHPYRHSDGNWYLYYARDFLDGERPGTSLVVAPLKDMVSIADDYRVVARATSDWQRFKAGRHIYGGVFDWHTLEGPNVIEHDGRLYCLYSGGCWMNNSYGVDYVIASSPMSEYSNDRPDAPRVLKTVGKRVIGPGHNSLVEGPDGQIYVAYHAWDCEGFARRFCLDRLSWTPEGPRCTPTIPEESPCA